MFYITQLVGVPAPAGFFYVHHSSSSKGSLVQRELSAAPPLTEGLSSPSAPSPTMNRRVSGETLNPVSLSRLLSCEAR